MVSVLCCAALASSYPKCTDDLCKQIFDANAISRLKDMLFDSAEDIRQEALRVFELTSDHGDVAPEFATLFILKGHTASWPSCADT